MGASVTMRDRGLQGLLGPVGSGEISPLFALCVCVFNALANLNLKANFRCGWKWKFLDGHQAQEMTWLSPQICCDASTGLRWVLD